MANYPGFNDKTKIETVEDVIELIEYFAGQFKIVYDDQLYALDTRRDAKMGQATCDMIIQRIQKLYGV